MTTIDVKTSLLGLLSILIENDVQTAKC
jgi:hypothetical protein